MVTREEFRSLLNELIFRIDQVAFISAKYQLYDELNIRNPRGVNIRGNIPHAQWGYVKTRFSHILRFQKAYTRYFVFAADPQANFIIPLPQSSLTLFISNILSDIQPNAAPPGYHTTLSILKFLQVSSYYGNSSEKLKKKHSKLFFVSSFLSSIPVVHKCWHFQCAL